jgi:transcriptional regulator with PAS, ATPase and Fis domain
MRTIFQYVEAIAPSPMPALITGETGVGKELIAASIHQLSGRSGAFIPLNVGGLDDHLFSDTLFGHQKGAFTGADRIRSGLIEQAKGGTLLLDEIGDLRIESQVKLLRLLQERKYYPLGADVPKLTDARIIVATNRELESMLETGRLRKDLYYRLQAHRIHLPPLRERRDDIPLLIEHFLSKAAETLGKEKPACPGELVTLLGAYHFPGNIRELESMIFDAVSRHKKGTLSTQSFRDKIGHTLSSSQTVGRDQAETTEESPILFPNPLPTLKEAERCLIAEAMKRSEENQTIAAQLLGLSRRALHGRLARSRE